MNQKITQKKTIDWKTVLPIDKVILNVGLGNPGRKYEFNRHNIGFLAIDEILKSLNSSSFRTKFYSNFTESNFENLKIIFIKPNTYMNNSGLAVLSAIKFYKISLNSVYVWHDDIDLNYGKIKVKVGGSNGGHNGIKSIDSAIGKDYVRIRIGVGKPPDHIDTSQWVLSSFSKDELNGWIKNILKKMEKEKAHLYNNDFNKFMNNISN